MIVDEVQVVEDDELRTYESNGQKMAKPKGGPVKAVRTPRAPRPGFNNGGGNTAAGPGVSSAPRAPSSPPVVETLKKVFVHIKDTDNQDALVQLKQISSLFPGLCDMVLVLGPDKQSAIKMPFRVDGSDELVGRLVKVLGEDAVVLK
jgi:hypothetical protein